LSEKTLPSPTSIPPRDNGGQCHHHQAVANISSASAQRHGVGIFCWSSDEVAVGCRVIAESIDLFTLVYVLCRIIVTQAFVGGWIGFCNLLQFCCTLQMQSASPITHVVAFEF
jgi:hypothetical protein